MTLTGQEGGEGYPKLVTNSVKLGVKGAHANSDITTKKIIHKFLLFACFWSARQQLKFGWYSGRGVISSIGLTSRAQAK